MSEWQYMGKGGSNPFAEAMMDAGLPEYTKGPRQAFFASDKRATDAGFPTDHQYSFQNPMTGKHMSWIPDTNASISENPQKGDLDKVYKNENLYKVYPELRKAQYDPGMPRGHAGAVGLQVGKRIFGNRKEIPHETQHMINEIDELTRLYSTKKKDYNVVENIKNFAGGNKRYFNSDNEATARLANELFKYGGEFTPWGANAEDAIRTNMEDLTGSKKFWKEK